MRRSREPFLWALFSGGGMASALLLPAIAFLLWIAVPLGWVEGGSYETLFALVRNPLVRLVLFALISLFLFHWAHRLRYTLYDGLQLYHLNQLIAVVTYGIASFMTVVAAYILWVFA